MEQPGLDVTVVRLVTVQWIVTLLVYQPFAPAVPSSV